MGEVRVAPDSQWVRFDEGDVDRWVPCVAEAYDVRAWPSFFLPFGSILTFDSKLEMSLITFMTLQMIVNWQTSVSDILPTCHDIYVEHR